VWTVSLKETGRTDGKRLRESEICPRTTPQKFTLLAVTVTSFLQRLGGVGGAASVSEAHAASIFRIGARTGQPRRQHIHVKLSLYQAMGARTVARLRGSQMAVSLAALRAGRPLPHRPRRRQCACCALCRPQGSEMSFEGNKGNRLGCYSV
jgi:hypothetical protein